MVEKKKRDLTEMQVKFLNYLFSEETKGRPQLAKKLAGYADGVNVYSLIASLKEEILERTKEAMAGSAPLAYFNLLDVLDNPSQAGAANALKAISEILNRAGVKEREADENKGPMSGIVLLPPKNGTMKIEILDDDSNEG